MKEEKQKKFGKVLKDKTPDNKAKPVAKPISVLKDQSLHAIDETDETHQIKFINIETSSGLRRPKKAHDLKNSATSPQKTGSPVKKPSIPSKYV